MSEHKHSILPCLASFQHTALDDDLDKLGSGSLPIGDCIVRIYHHHPQA